MLKIKINSDDHVILDDYIMKYCWNDHVQSLFLEFIGLVMYNKTRYAGSFAQNKYFFDNHIMLDDHILKYY